MVALRSALGVTAVAVLIARTWHAAPYPWWLWAPVQLAGLSFLISGVVLWARRPTNGTGRLMTALGLTWYIGHLQLLGDPVTFAIGFCFYHMSSAVMGHLVLSLPSGHLRHRYEQWLAASFYVASLVTQGARLVTEYPPQPQGWGDPHAVYSIWAPAGSLTMLAQTAVVVILLVRRWHAAARPVRREYALMWMTIVVMGIAVAVSVVAALSDAPVAVQRCLVLTYAVGLMVTPVALAAGLLRVRLGRLRIAELVVRLKETTEPLQVRNALAVALDDPCLDLWFPVDGRPVDADSAGGAPANRQVSTLVGTTSQPLAMVMHDQALREQRPLVNAALAAAHLALDNARLLATQRAQLHEVEASRARIVAATDLERRRIQRDLHDGVQHKLLVISMLVARAQRALAAADDPQRPNLTPVVNHLSEVIQDLRLLTEGIHLPALSEQGLAAAVEVLAERAAVPVVVDIPARRWPDQVERTAYFVISEALTNVYKHAHAGHAEIQVAEATAVDNGTLLTVSVRDNGTGGADRRRGTGLRGLEDRVATVGGDLRIDSLPGHGTNIVARLPCG